MKVEVASPDPNCPYGLCGREAMLKKKKKGRGADCRFNREGRAVLAYRDTGRGLKGRSLTAVKGR